MNKRLLIPLLLALSLALSAGASADATPPAERKPRAFLPYYIYWDDRPRNCLPWPYPCYWIPTRTPAPTATPPVTSSNP